MALTDDVDELQIIFLTKAEIEDGFALSAEAGWNQDCRDWAMMLHVGQGFGIRVDGQVFASCVAIPQPPLLGWVSMVLVHKAFRRRGLAR